MTLDASTSALTEDTDTPAPLWKRLGSLALKLAVAGLLVWWLLASGRLDPAIVAKAVASPAGATYAIIAILLAIAADFSMAWRFHYLLEHRGVGLPWGETIVVTLAANLTAVVLPGLLGADALRIAYLAKRSRTHRVDAVTAVFVDRVIGLVALFVLAAIASPVIAWLDLVTLDSRVLLIGPAIAVVSVLVIAVLGSPALGRIRWLRGLVARLPDWVGRSAVSIRAYARAPRVLAFAILLAMLNHALVIGCYACAGLILADRVPFVVHFALDPLALVLNAVPLTPGGLGLSEGAFSLLYQGAGSDLGATIGLLGRMLQYLGLAIAGVPALVMLRSPSKQAALEPTDDHAEQETAAQSATSE